MTILDEYLAYYKKYSQKYGKNMVIFYQNGGFFELYSGAPGTVKETNIYEIANCLNLQVTRRNKSIIEINDTNFLMAGWPLSALDRYVNILTEEYHYIVVVVEQITPVPNPKRAVTRIISPASNISNVDDPRHHYIMSLFVDQIKTKSHSRKGTIVSQTGQITYAIGISLLDPSIGNSIVYENILSSTAETSKSSKNLDIEDINRILHTFAPMEIIISSRDFDDMSYDEFLKSIEIDPERILIHNKMWNALSPEMTKISYQNELLKKVYPQTGMLSPIEHIGLEFMPNVLISFCVLMSYCNEQNENILKSVQKPVMWSNHRTLILDNNSISQLNLTSGKNGRSGERLSSLLTLIDQTSTPFGRRLLRDRLLVPITDSDMLNLSYKLIECGIAHRIDQSLEPLLTNIVDLEKYHHRLELGLISPLEFHKFYTSLESCLELLNYMRKSHSQWLNDLVNVTLNWGKPITSSYVEHSRESCPLDTGDDRGTVDADPAADEDDFEIILTPSSVHMSRDNTLLSYIDQMCNSLSHLLMNISLKLDIELLSKSAWPEPEQSFFRSNYSPLIDVKSHQLYRAKQFFTQLVKSINTSYYSRQSKKKVQEGGICRYEYKEQYGYHIIMTTNRYKDLCKLYTEPIVVDIGDGSAAIKIDLAGLDADYNKQGNQVHLTSSFIRSQSHVLLNIEKDISTEIVKEFQQRFITEFSHDNHGLIRRLIDLIGNVDLYHSHIKSSNMLNYKRPEISTSGSFLNFVGIRHPIIEKLPSKETYVPIDIDFRETRGVILFGVNCSGKSSLMKAIGMNLVLAQMGMFVAANTMIFSPYHKILTRIIGNDNIFKALSSYAVEITELRGILSKADSHSLVLCDELSKGSESISGTALVASTMIKLSDCGSTFISASHLHGLAELNELRQLSTV